MKLSIKILLFVFVALVFNVNITSAAIAFPNIQKATASPLFHVKTQKTVVGIIENYLVNYCQNGNDLVDYRNRGTGIETVAAKTSTAIATSLEIAGERAWIN
jgi:hypothetical protein